MPVEDAHRSPSEGPIRVFVHLAENKDAERWRAGWAAGTLVGINDATPYGYGRANDLGCSVTFSKGCHEGPLSKLARYGLRAILGFDFLHAWRQRKAFAEADVIWTHTESQYLAVAAVAKLTGTRTKIIGQTVWLFDHWFSLSWLKRTLYAGLVPRVDVLTFLSPLNLEVARKLFPAADVQFVPFGIPTETKIAPRSRPGPVRVLAIGNDRHRDWQTLVAAAKAKPELSVVILSGTVAKRLVRNIPNVEVRRARHTRELMAEMEKASVLCVPLKPNLHASGITAIEEGALAGLPIVASDTGGLRAYFPEEAVRYVVPQDPMALADALLEVGRKPDEMLEMAVRAQGRMAPGGLGVDEYVRAHVLISRDLLRKADFPDEAP